MMLKSFISMRTFYYYLIEAILSSLINLVTLVNPPFCCYFIILTYVLLINSVFIETTTYLDLRDALVLAKNSIVICNSTCLTSSVFAVYWCLVKSHHRIPNSVFNFQWFLNGQEVNFVNSIIMDFLFDFPYDSHNI